MMMMMLNVMQGGALSSSGAARGPSSMRALKTTTTTTTKSNTTVGQKVPPTYYKGGAERRGDAHATRAKTTRDFWVDADDVDKKATTFTTTTQNVTHNVGWKMMQKKRGSMQKHEALMGRRPSASAGATFMDSFSKFSAVFSNLFPLWTVLSAALALTKPAFFNFMTTPTITFCLALLMFSMGITLTVDDFLRVFKKPDVIGLGFLYCYGVMPALAFFIGNAIGLSGPLLAGLILVGSINGGQASNLCAYIAKGDVALSVLMTTATTIGCIFMTPLICKLALGAIVDVNAIGMAISTIKVVLVPVVLGVTLNKVTPKTCRTVEPFCPIVGVIMTVILVGGSVAQCADGILNAGVKLQIAAFMLHLLGGVLGYWGMKVLKYSETTCRTCAIETAMKSSAFGFLLASLHFPEFLVRVPSAVSVVWMAVMGSMMAVVWRFIPVEGE